jgi:hypothetical protein
MKYFTHIIFWMLLFGSVAAVAQDKVFLRDGKIIQCKIVAISENTISYRDTIPNSALVTLPKNDVLITEYGKSESVYLFSKEQPAFVVQNNSISFSTTPEIIETREQRQTRRIQEWKEKEALMPNGILGFYIVDLVFGRLTVSYERLLANKSIGITIPVSLTYDGLGALAEFSSNSSNASNTNNSSSNSSSTNTTSSNNSSSSNTTNAPVKRNVGTGIITGVDISYYHDLKPQLKYFFGPRIRYGTDMTLGGIEGLTFQMQNGIFKSSGKRFTSTLALGVGFFKLSAKYAGRGGFDSKQVYPWGSFTWRLGFRL